MDESHTPDSTLGGDAGSAVDYTRPFMEQLPVSGAAVSTMGELLGTETISASDPVAARLDELQFDLGEGPCWDAVRLRRPVMEADVRGRPSQVWPAFSQAALDEGVAALYAFPMLIGPLRIGAIDMYSREARTLDPSQTKQAELLADLAGRRVLQRALRAMTEDYSEDTGNPYSRRIVHQATGMVLAQLSMSADDALLVIQAHAFATNRPMMEVSQDVLDGRLDLSAVEGEGESSA